MSEKKKKKSRNEILEIIDQFDKKAQTQISQADDISDLKQKLKLLVTKVAQLEEALSNKDLIIDKKEEIISRKERKVTELTSLISTLEDKMKRLEKRESELLSDLQLFMKDVDVKADSKKLDGDKVKLIGKGAKSKAKKIIKIKLLMLGEYSVGKTSFIKRFTQKKFITEYKPTIGAEITKVRLRFKDSQIELVIWDVAGQIAFKRMADRFIQGASAVILVYDVGRIETHKSVKDWYDHTLKVLGKKIPAILVANKVDLGKKRKVSIEQGKKLAHEIDAKYIETSVLKNTNVYESLTLLISNYLNQLNTNSN